MKRKKKVDAKVKETKQRFGVVSDTAKEFIREFNPAWLVRSETTGQFAFSPKVYAKHLKKGASKAGGFLYHSMGLLKASMDAGWYLLSYMNPCSYCRKSKYQ